MDPQGKVIVVTGAARGIGAALAKRFVQAGAKSVVISDLVQAEVDATAKEIGAQSAFQVDVADEQQIVKLIEETESRHGPIDLFCSNAGISVEGSLTASNEIWQKIWEINSMSHVYAARAIVPKMIQRGGGYLLNTVSAAGLLTQLGSAPYAVTKHAAMAFAEWLAITYQRDGIKVSALCPQGVRTRLLESVSGGAADMLKATSISPEQVAECVMEGLAAERFLILPHPEVGTYFQNKANDYERWLKGMRKLWDQFEPPGTDWEHRG